MRSFGVWYSKKDAEETMGTLDKFSVDLHINLWDIGYGRAERNENFPFIDIGLNIRGFREIDSIFFKFRLRLKKKRLRILPAHFVKNQ